jgi:hypothetical protein
MSRLLPFTILAFSLLISFPASGWELEIKVGPPHVDGGGSNPVGIPPSGGDLDITIVTAANTEWSFAPIPAMGYGYRFSESKNGGYVSMGGGFSIVRSLENVDIGPYFAVGKRGKFWMGEFKQLLGVSGGLGRISTPAALRVGFYW